MQFTSRQIRGEGRGHKIGFPTINLVVPIDLALEQGIYAAWITIGDATYKGALHFGAIPTFDQKEKTMEVHLLDFTDDNVPNTQDIPIEINIVSRLRGIKKFTNVEDLALQIGLDIENVKSLLK